VNRSTPHIKQASDARDETHPTFCIHTTTYSTPGVTPQPNGRKQAKSTKQHNAKQNKTKEENLNEAKLNKQTKSSQAKSNQAKKNNPIKLQTK
jgi:hypothetical protein